MSEKFTPTAEYERSQPANVELVETLISESGKSTLRSELEDELNATPAYQHFKQIDTDFNRATEGMRRWEGTGPVVEGQEDAYYAAYDERVKRFDFAVDSLWGKQAHSRYQSLVAELAALDDGRVELRDHSAVTLLQTLIEGSPEEPAHAGKLFVDSEHLNRMAQAADSRGASIRIGTGRKQTVEIPVSYCISAQSFDSWLGRGEGGRGKKLSTGGAETSLETIIEYAEAETAPPPVNDISAYVLPDGRIYFQSNNAHRLASAIRRGDTHLEFSGEATVYLLKNIPADLDRSWDRKDD